MVQGLPALLVLVPSEHREVGYPERLPALLHQAVILTKLDAQRAQRVVDDLLLTGAEEDEVAVPGAGALEDAGKRFVGKKLHDGRLQPILAGVTVVDLDIGQTPGSVDGDELCIAIHHRAGQRTTAG